MANKETISVALKLISDISDVTGNLKGIQKALNSLKVPANLKTNFDKIFSDLEKEAGRISGLMAGGFKKAGDVTKLENSYKTVNTLMYQLQTNMNKISENDLKNSFQIDTKLLDAANQKILGIQKSLADIAKNSGLDKVEESVKRLQSINKGGKSAGNFLTAFKAGDVQGAEAALRKLEESFGRVKDKSSESGQIYKQVITDLRGSMDALSSKEVQELINQLNLAEKELKDLGTKEFNKLVEAFQKTATATSKMTGEIQEYGKETTNAAKHQNELNNEVDQMKNRVKSFFSLTNSVYLFQRALRSAFETVKELDAAMTEIAVVSDFSVGDMWEQLPKFTEQANELGTSIKDVYQATTLFVQQGLNLNASLELSNETLKMARIAGMDAAAATDAMTAALRGFNMELSATSGQKINDVYSELAAITAADTQEISTAMTKTASIAHSAGMEFETTAAFLSQIIETTRESAETAGTAMKTVIARFQELKKAPSEIGEVDGEIVDANKIETALKTIGVALRDSEGQFRELDDVFLEIAQKWSSLDKNTQRYIATMAAGSRQQSRFIAMMSDYDRTMELVDAANNSAGSSTKQFNKTLESMDAKLNKLKNAWDQFAMSLANNEFLKLAVDTLTTLLTTINNLIDSVSGGSGLIKSILSLGVAFGGIKLGGALFNKALGSKTSTNIIEKFTGKPKDAQNIGQEVGKNVASGIGNGFKKYSPFSKDFLRKTILSSFSKEELGISFASNLLDFSNVTVDKSSLDNLKKNLKNQLSSLDITPKQKIDIGNLIEVGRFDEANEELLQLKRHFSLTGKEAEEAGVKLKKAEIDVKALGTAFGVAGMAMTGFGEILKGLGAEKAGKVFQFLGATLMGLGAIIPLVSFAADKMGFSFNKAGLAALKASVAAQGGWMAVLGPIGLVIAGATILIGLFSHIYKMSPEQQLKKAEEAAAEAGEAAEKATQSFEELNTSITNLGKQYDTLEELTIGTKEWKAAVKEVNDEVLDLISKYPELSKLAKMDSGVLKLDTESKEFQDFLRTQEQTASKARAGEISSQIEIAKKQTDVDYKNLTKKGGIYSNYTDEYEKEKTKELARGLSSGTITDTGVKGTKSVEQFLEEEGLNLKDFPKGHEATIESLKAFGNALEQTDLQIQAYNNALAVNALSMIDSSKMTKNQIEEFSDMVTDKQMQRRTQEEEKALQNWGDVDNDIKNEYEKFFKDVYGDTVKVKSGGKVQYTDETGKTQKITAEQAKQQFAAAKATEKAAKFLENVSNEMSNMSKEEKAQLKAMSSGDLGNLTAAQLESFTGELEAEILASKLGYKSVDELYADLGYGNKEQFTTDIQEIKKQMLGVKANAMTIFEDKSTMGTNLSSLVENYSINTIKALSEQIKNMGKDEAGNYIKEFNNVLSSSNFGEDQKKLLEMNLSSINWSNMESAVQAMQDMQDMGLSDSQIQTFWRTATEGANTYVKTVEEAKDVTTLFSKETKLIDEIQDRFSKGEATEADIEKLKNAGVDLKDILVQTAEGWKLTEEAAIQATDALRMNLVIQSEAALQAQKDSYNERTKLLENKSMDRAITEREGKYVAETDFEKLTSNEVTEIGSQLGVTNTGIETIDKARIEKAYEDYLNELNESKAATEELQRQADFQRGQVLTAAENEATGGTQESIVQSVQTEAKRAGINPDDVMAYTNALMEMNSELDKATAAQAALGNAKMNKGLEEIMDSYEDWSSLIDKTTGLIKTGSMEDAVAYGNLKKSVNKMLNTSAELSNEFWQNAENMKNIKAAAEGDTKALGELQTAAAQDYLTNVVVDMADINGNPFDEEAKTKINDLADFIGNYQLPKLDVGQTIDDQEFINKCNELIEASRMTSEQVAESFKAMGYDVAFDDNLQETEQVTRLPVTQYHLTASLKDGINLMPTVTEVEHRSKSLVPAPTIKTLTSTGSRGGGVSAKNTKKGADVKKKATPKPAKAAKPKKEEKKKDWENPFDELYNLTEEVNEALRQREKLEREYDRILKRREGTYQQLRNNQQAQINSLEKEIQLQKQLQAGRKRQIEELGQETYTDDEGNTRTFSQMGVTKYASYDEKTGVINIDWNAIDKVKDEDQGAAIEAYIGKLEELSKQYEDTQETIEEMQDIIEEIKKKGMEEYLDFEKRIYDALVNEQQAVIDSYQELSDSITDSNTEILNSLQESIDLERQIKENTKTEEDINEKEARLAFLRRDTSNANDMEIRRLEEELADSREAYGEQLVDQELDRLNKQAAEAAEQRERQIAIMQSQLDYQAESGAFWEETYKLLQNGFAEDGSLNTHSDLYNLLQEDAGWQGLSKFGKMNFAEEMRIAFEQAMIGHGNWMMAEAEKNKTLTLGNGTKLTYDGKNWKDDKGNVYKGVSYNSQTGQFTYGSIETPSKPTSNPPKKPPQNQQPQKPKTKPIPSSGWGVTVAKGAKFTNGKAMNESVRVSGFDKKHKGGFYVYQKSGDDYLLGNGGSNKAPNWTGWVNKKYLTAYKKGGLANFTGPAWLDGTKTSPELILNARDTENFLMLKDVLSSLVKNGIQSGKGNNGDNYFDIKIEVEELSNDYDVEQLTRKIKQEITNDAQYRNVNAINFLR